MGPGSGNNDFTGVCSGSETGSYLRLTDFVYHSTLGSRVIKKKVWCLACSGLACSVYGGGAADRDSNNLKVSKYICLKNGSSQGQDLALTVLCVPNSLDSGMARLVSLLLHAMIFPPLSGP